MSVNYTITQDLPLGLLPSHTLLLVNLAIFSIIFVVIGLVIQILGQIQIPKARRPLAYLLLKKASEGVFFWCYLPLITNGTGMVLTFIRILWEDTLAKVLATGFIILTLILTGFFLLRVVKVFEIRMEYL